MLIPDLIIQMITVVIGVALYATIFKIVKNLTTIFSFRLPKLKKNESSHEKGTLTRSVLRRCSLAPYVPLPAEGSESVPFQT